MLEVELAKLASARSQNPEVARFANRIFMVHAEANAALATLAIAKGLKVPTRLDAEHQSMIEFFKGKSGDEFDAAYMRHVATANAKTTALYGRASRLNDVGLATFAKRTLPTLRENAQLAQGARASPGKSVTTSAL
jgi:putative membrane protein